MLTKFLNFWKSEKQENIDTPANVNIVFELSYKEAFMGYLSLDQGVWKFIYSEEFKMQENLLPLVDFPNKHETYASKQLWPFF